MVDYKHTLNAALAEGLRRIARKGGGPLNIKQLGLTRNQWDNFQKLRYWGFVAKATRPDGRRIGGAWVLTVEGKRFLDGHVSAPKNVWTHRGQAIRADGERVMFREVAGPYKTRPEYAAEAQPHRDLFA